MRYEVMWLIPVEADDVQHAAALAWLDVRTRDACPVSIVQPMRDELLRDGPAVVVDAPPAGVWLPGSLAELALLNPPQGDDEMNAPKTQTTTPPRPLTGEELKHVSGASGLTKNIRTPFGYVSVPDVTSKHSN